MRFKVPARLPLARCLWLVVVLVSLLSPAAAAAAATSCGTQCGLGCPTTSCYAKSTSTSFSCSSSGNIQTTCASPVGATLSTCEDTCPTGYYVTAGRGNVQQCQLGYQGFQTDCALLSGAGQTLLTCDDHCPTGYLPSRVTSGAVVCSGRYERLGSIQTQCSKVTGQSFDTCLACPDGYYPTSSIEDTINCGRPYTNFRTHCEKVAGASLLTCEDTCPTGYVPTALYEHIPQCEGGGFLGLQTRCTLITGDTLVTCETGCPDGFYPTATSTNPQCKVRYSLETSCSKVQGPTLTTCGGSCPAGYFLVRTQSSPSCGAVYGKQSSTCSTVNPQGPSIVTQPKSTTITAGQSVTLTVVAQGQAPLAYQWYTGTSGDQSHPIAGATSATLHVSPTITTSYWVQVSNTHGAVASDTATVTVTPACVPASITAQPAPVSIEVGQSATLTVAANGSSLVYQWYQGAAPDTSHPVPGGAAATVTVTPAVTTSYWVRVSNSCSGVNSSAATVTVQPACVALAITVQPHSITISEGQVAPLSVSASGTSPTYQWYQGASGDTAHPLAGATAASISVAPPSTTSYWVRATNSCSHADSDTATVTVTVCVAPLIGTQPQPVTIDEGAQASLSVAASGTSLTYQWYEGTSGDTSRPVSGGNSASLVVSPPATTSYWVRIANDCGSVDSDSAQVTVNPGCVPPAIPGLGQPQSVSIVDGESATLSVTAFGSAPTYQWYEGAGTAFPITGATGSTVVVAPHATTTYWVRLTNGCGSADSNLATVTVSPACVPPGITGQPQPVTINDGQTATLSVTASGTSPAYQWYQGESGDVSNPVAGGTGPSLAVAPHATTSYWVRISNACGSFDSGTAVVTVTPVCVPVAFTAQPQSASILLGQSATLAVAASGTSPAFQWYVGGSGDTAQPVSGGIGSSLVVSPAITTSYWVRAANACSQADSITAVITVADCGMPPAITSQPSSVTLEAGQTATLTVGAAGSGLTYQWYEGVASDPSHPVPGAVGPSLTVAPATTTSYWVRVANNCGVQDSTTATVTVTPPPCQPVITSQPQSVTIDSGQVATLAVDASGASLSYQWYQGSTGDLSQPVPGGTGSVLVVAPAATTSYWVHVFNPCGSADSATATVTVNVPGCGADGTPCGGDGNHTCQGGQCVCSNCASGVCCGTAGNSFCDGQQHFDPNTGYSGACASTLAGCDSSNDFDGGNAVYHDGDILACVKHNGAYEWYPRRPSPRCQEVSPVCGFVCSTHYAGGLGFMCDQDGVWNQSPPLPYCYGGTIPDGFACQ